jgi:hypothetical protein
MGRTACTEPQCLYSRAIPLLPLWTVRPVQSLSACTTVHLGTWKHVVCNAAAQFACYTILNEIQVIFAGDCVCCVQIV